MMLFLGFLCCVVLIYGEIKFVFLLYSIWCLGAYRARMMRAIAKMRDADPTTIFTGRENFSFLRGIIVGSILSAVKYQFISTLASSANSETLDSW